MANLVSSYFFEYEVGLNLLLDSSDLFSLSSSLICNISYFDEGLLNSTVYKLMDNLILINTTAMEIGFNLEGFWTSICSIRIIIVDNLTSLVYSTTIIIVDLLTSLTCIISNLICIITTTICTYIPYLSLLVNVDFIHMMNNTNNPNPIPFLPPMPEPIVPDKIYPDGRPVWITKPDIEFPNTGRRPVMPGPFQIGSPGSKGIPVGHPGLMEPPINPGPSIDNPGNRGDIFKSPNRV
jgi:hypothetical protein